MDLPLAHVGHWYHAILYLAPVVIVVVALWAHEKRHPAEDDDEELEPDEL